MIFFLETRTPSIADDEDTVVHSPFSRFAGSLRKGFVSLRLGLLILVIIQYKRKKLNKYKFVTIIKKAKSNLIINDSTFFICPTADRDLAELYGVETAQLKRAVRRNIDRFPEDFMFGMSKKELEDWRCQIGISNPIKMGLRYLPMVFTEQGVAMLSSILNSKRAIQVNIQIMRAFYRLRQMLAGHKELPPFLMRSGNC